MNFNMCNSYEMQYTLCGHITPSTFKNQTDQYWELCRNALLTNKKCDFAVLAEGFKDKEGRCPSCMEREEKAKEKWRARLRARRGKEGYDEELP
jgi:hypothetical protein